MEYIDYTAVTKSWASLVGEKSYVELQGNQIAEMIRLMRTEKNLGEVLEMRREDLRPERLGDPRIMNLGEN